MTDMKVIYKISLFTYIEYDVKLNETKSAAMTCRDFDWICSVFLHSAYAAFCDMVTLVCVIIIIRVVLCFNLNLLVNAYNFIYGLGNHMYR